MNLAPIAKLNGYPFGKPLPDLWQQYDQIQAMLKPLGRTGLKQSGEKQDPVSRKK